MTWIVDFQVSRVVHSKKKDVLVWKDSRIKNSCIARYVCDMRRMSRAMYNILCVASYIRLDLFHKKNLFLQAQAHAYRGTSTGTGTYNKYIVVLPRIQLAGTSSQVCYISGIFSLTENCEKMDHRDLQDYRIFTSQPPTIWASKSLILPTIWTSKSSKISQVYKPNSQSQR